MDTPNNTKDAEGLEIVAVWLDKDGLIEPAAMLRRLATALRAPVAQPVSVPAAYISHNVLTAKDHFDRVPLTSLQPGVYKHTPLYLKPDADFERLRSILASEIECLIFEQHVLPALAVAEKALSDHTVPTVVDAAPIGYLPAYELERLNSGHDAILRSAKFGPSALDGDVPVFAVPSLTNHERIELYELREGAEPASVAQDAAGEPVARTAPFNNCQFRHCDLPGQCRAEGKCHHPVPGAWRGRGTAPAIPVADAPNDLEQYVLSVLPSVYYMDPPDGGDVTVLEQLRRMADDAAKYRDHAKATAQRTDDEGLTDERNFAWSALSEAAVICESVAKRFDEEPRAQYAADLCAQEIQHLLALWKEVALAAEDEGRSVALTPKRINSVLTHADEMDTSGWKDDAETIRLLAARPANAKPVLTHAQRVAIETAMAWLPMGNDARAEIRDFLEAAQDDGSAK